MIFCKKKFPFGIVLVFSHFGVDFNLEVENISPTTYRYYLIFISWLILFNPCQFDIYLPITSSDSVFDVNIAIEFIFILIFVTNHCLFLKRRFWIGLNAIINFVLLNPFCYLNYFMTLLPSVTSVDFLMLDSCLWASKIWCVYFLFNLNFHWL